MKLKKINVAINTLEEYISLHKGIYSITEKECTVIACILRVCPDGSFSKSNKKDICTLIGESNSYLNVYIDRMMKNRVILPTSTGYQVTTGIIPQGEEAMMIRYEKSDIYR